jgi:hypothetical protein
MHIVDINRMVNIHVQYHKRRGKGKSEAWLHTPPAILKMTPGIYILNKNPISNQYETLIHNVTE